VDKFYEIYEFYYVPFWKSKPFTISASVILGCLILFVLYKLIKYLKKRGDKPLTIWQIAERELLDLDPSELTSKDEFKRFYFKLSEVLKGYLSKRYSFNLEDKTDDEIETYLRSKLFDTQMTKDLIEILHGSRFVKFAGEEALPARAKEDWEKGLGIVSDTIPHDS